MIFTVFYADRTWKITNDSKVVGTYAKKDTALQRLRQLVKTAQERGAHVEVIIMKKRAEAAASSVSPIST